MRPLSLRAPPRNRTLRHLLIRQGSSTRRVVTSGCGESRTRKAACAARPDSNRVPSPVGLHIPSGETGSRTRKAAHVAAQDSRAEGAGFEPAHDLRRDLGLANRRLTARPTFHQYAGRESNPHVRRHTLLRRARLPVTPPALGATGQIRTGPTTMARLRAIR
jgi:hypothetical protein